MSWLQTYKTPGAEYTHLLLDGGKLRVPDDQHTLFLTEYANAVARSEKMRVVEARTEVFRLFIDFDFKPPPEDAKIVRATILSACRIAEYFFDTTSCAVVLEKDVASPDKVGVHVTWDDIFVTSTGAMAFRNHLVARLEDARAGVSWKDVVDSSVYTGSGLRMPWSLKRTGPGKYVPAWVCRGGNLEAVSPQPSTAPEIREWIRRTCIRAPDAEATRSCMTVEDAANDSTTPTQTTSQTTSRMPVPSCVDGLVPRDYTDHKFTSAHRFGDGCLVLRSSSRVCGNKGMTPHAHSTVYFVLLKRGVMYQRCYCRKDATHAGATTTCREYASDPWPVPQAVIDEIWPPPKPKSAALAALLEKTRPPLAKKRCLKDRRPAP